MVRTRTEVYSQPGGRAGAGASPRPLGLSKHEAAGNDFLVLVDLDGEWDLGPVEARWLCDRRRGVGADGLLLAHRHRGSESADLGTAGADLGTAGADLGTAGADLGTAGADLGMVLYNADGSRAEMSGNGVRCLVQAAVRAGAVRPGTVRVSTDAGLRTIEVEPLRGGTGATAWASAEMGPVRLGREVPSPVPGARARLADVGNPHLVVLGDVALETLDLTALHRAATDLLGAPVNVEVVRPAGPDALALRVFERGAGETLACGTGSCAAAAVAHGFGETGEVVQVVNPGGSLEVHLLSGAGDDSPRALLAGLVHHVADVVVDAERFRAFGGDRNRDGEPARSSGAR